MQIVIDIPDDKYEWIKNHKGLTTYPNTMMLYNRVRKGIILPEKHGRLIDADELKKHKYHDGNRYENAVSVAQVDWMPTILEATESEEQA